MRKHRLRPRLEARRRRSVERPLRVEPMERRQLLATLIVNTAVDENVPTNATLSLREAIELTDGILQVSALSAAAQTLVSGSPNSARNPGAWAILFQESRSGSWTSKGDFWTAIGQAGCRPWRPVIPAGSRPACERASIAMDSCNSKRKKAGREGAGG